MYTLDLLRDLYRHMEWADATVWSIVNATDDAQADGRLRELLFHVHFTQEAFLSVWKGEEVTFKSADAFPSLAEVQAWCRAFYGEAAAFLDDLSSERLDDPAPVPWVKYFARRWGRDAAVTTLGDTLMQVAMHSLYHRGQVNKQLRELGGEPPLVDYIAWIWMDRPAPDWG